MKDWSRRDVFRYAGMTGAVGLTGFIGLEFGSKPAIASPTGVPRIANETTPGENPVSPYNIEYQNLNTSSDIEITYIFIDSSDTTFEDTHIVSLSGKPTTGTVNTGSHNVTVPSGDIQLSIEVSHPSLLESFSTSPSSVTTISDAIIVDNGTTVLDSFTGETEAGDKTIPSYDISYKGLDTESNITVSYVFTDSNDNKSTDKHTISLSGREESGTISTGVHSVSVPEGTLDLDIKLLHSSLEGGLVTTVGSIGEVYNFGFGNGSLGNNTISSHTAINKYSFLTSNVSSTATSISVNNSDGFNSGDRALLIQMQDSSSAGKNEFVTIQSTSPGTINLEEKTMNSYESGNSNSTNSKTAQLVKIPQFENLTIDSSGSLVSKDWDGKTGGVICISVSSTLTINGDIDASSSGFRGGTGGRGDFTPDCGTFDSRNHSEQGESFKGVGLINHNPNDGGGGGTTPDDQCCATGGGGGGFGSSGGNGHAECGGTFEPGSSGEGGPSYGNPELSNIFLGSGGGGGSGDSNQSPSEFNGERGGRGGGIVLILAKDVVNNGNIISNGEDAPVGPSSGSGGGSGGSVKVVCDTFNNSGTVKAVGGNGAPSMTYTGSGGDGGDGRIKTNFISSISADSNPPYEQEQISKGPLL